jgi:hypothetical protein
MPDFIEQQHDFSLVLGGPTFQFFRRTHLEGDHVELLRRRVTVITLLVWLPLLLLSVFTLAHGGARLSFLRDIEVHARFLVALPILIGCELLVHLRIGPVIRRFVERQIVRPQELPRFDNAIESAVRMGNSVPSSLGFCLLSTLWEYGSGVAGSDLTHRRGMPTRADARI